MKDDPFPSVLCGMLCEQLRVADGVIRHSVVPTTAASAVDS